MKQLSIIHTEWSKGWGGQEIRTLNEARGVADRGHRVVIVARTECKILSRAHQAGLSTRELSMRHGFDLQAIAGLRRLIRRESADIVNTHSSIDSWIGAPAAKTTGTKLVRTRHVSIPIRRHPLNFVHRLPDAIITTGEAIRHQLVENNRLKAESIVSIPTGIDVDHFSPQPPTAELRHRLGLPDNALIVTTIGVLRRKKRHDVLVRATARLCQHRSVCLVLAGEGSQRPRIEQLARDLGISQHVRLLGHVEDVRWVLRDSDVVVSSSSGMEGVPQALVQALAMSRPVVATDDGSVSELVQHRVTGLLVPLDDPEALAIAVGSLSDDPALAKECGARGRAHVVKHYSREQMIDRVLQLYRRLQPC